jgi:hypothetical protein
MKEYGDLVDISINQKESSKLPTYNNSPTTPAAYFDNAYDMAYKYNSRKGTSNSIKQNSALQQ